jgi:hypothetical protein
MNACIQCCSVLRSGAAVLKVTPLFGVIEFQFAGADLLFSACVPKRGGNQMALRLQRSLMFIDTDQETIRPPAERNDFRQWS